jgi:hypothetical protein
MRVSSHAPIDSPVEPYEGTDSAGRDAVTALEELLAHSIQLRDLYKYGRLHSANIRFHHLFHNHYKEQLRVVDVLIDRIRLLGGSGRVFASDFLQGGRSTCVNRGRWSPAGLMRELLERHELVLSLARPVGRDDRSWAYDFAVGQVVLTNDLQAWSINEQYATQDTRRSFHHT